jgi:hypothetical protein
VHHRGRDQGVDRADPGAFFDGATKMKFKLIAGLFALSFLVSTGIPVGAAQAAHWAKFTRHLVRHSDAARRQTVFEGIDRARAAHDQSRPTAPKDDWPANMILDSFRSHDVSNAERMASPYVI